MRRLFLIVLGLFVSVVVFYSCSLSTSDIEKETKDLMINKYKEDGQKLVINDLTLIHDHGNSYKGIADCILDGERIQLDLSVLCDGNNIQAEWEPTAEYWQQAFEEALEEDNDYYQE